MLGRVISSWNPDSSISEETSWLLAIGCKHANHGGGVRRVKNIVTVVFRPALFEDPDPLISSALST